LLSLLMPLAGLQTLPTDPAQARRNLVAIEQELTQMDKEHKQLRSTAKRWPRFWLWAGFAALSFQVRAISTAAVLAVLVALFRPAGGSCSRPRAVLLRSAWCFDAVLLHQARMLFCSDSASPTQHGGR
jgi:hypothetical protein